MSLAERKIAYIIPGGVGTGKNNIGVPVLERVMTPLLALMAKRESLMLYVMVEPASGSVAEAVIPIAVPAAAFWAIWLAAGLASGEVLNATGSGLLRTARVKAWLAVLPSDEVAVTVRLIDDWVSKSSAPVAERVMTPLLELITKRESLML